MVRKFPLKQQNNETLILHIDLNLIYKNTVSKLNSHINKRFYEIIDYKSLRLYKEVKSA